MCDFAVQNAGVKKTLAEDRAAQAQEDFKEDDNWQAQLDLERNGTIKDTMANISAILRHDPKLQGIVYNQFSNLLDVREALPWQQVKPGWSDTDLACAKLYFERCYGIWSPTKFKDALLAVTSAERLYHPVRDYLESLVWDGMPGRAAGLLAAGDFRAGGHEKDGRGDGEVVHHPHRRQVPPVLWCIRREPHNTVMDLSTHQH